MNAVVSTKGQVVIPHEIRKALGIHPGDTVIIKSSQRQIILEKATTKPSPKVKFIKGKMPLVKMPQNTEALTPEMVKEIAQI